MMEFETHQMKVMVRPRPLWREERAKKDITEVLDISPLSPKVEVNEYFCFPGDPQYNDQNPKANIFSTHIFDFDRVFLDKTSQQQLFEEFALPAITHFLKGFNSTVIAYGQTGTGKTYTMQGMLMKEPENWGLIQRSINYLLQPGNDQWKVQGWSLKVSYCQIYMENISDLLDISSKSLQLREDPTSGTYIEGLSSFEVIDIDQIINLLKKGEKQRITASTRINDCSSRSHTIFSIMLEGPGREEQGRVMGPKINLVDLAGSERVKVTGAKGQRLSESKKINQSLSTLSKVIVTLSEQKEGKQLYVPYRDSKLTRILENSLGGNCVTALLCTVSPNSNHIGETLSTLRFGTQVRKVKTKAKANIISSFEEPDPNSIEGLSQLKEELKSKQKRIKELENELNTLKKEGESNDDKSQLDSCLNHECGWLTSENHHQLVVRQAKLLEDLNNKILNNETYINELEQKLIERDLTIKQLRQQLSREEKACLSKSHPQSPDPKPSSDTPPSKQPRRKSSSKLLNDSTKKELKSVKKKFEQQIEKLNKTGALREKQLKNELSELNKNNIELIKMVDSKDNNRIDQRVREQVGLLQSKIKMIIDEFSTKPNPRSLEEVERTIRSLQLLLVSLQSDKEEINPNIDPEDSLPKSKKELYEQLIGHIN